jgi:hypothetical protein
MNQPTASAREEEAFAADETNAEMPAFLRKKVVQGKGKGRGEPTL